MKRILHPTLTQGTSDWHAIRAGRLTSTGAAKILPLRAFTGTGKDDIAATRRAYLLQLVAERLTGEPAGDEFTSPAMERGTLLEPAARDAYIAQTGHQIEEVGFVEIEGLLVGDSPDGVVYGPEGTIEGCVEIKCPGATNHLKWRDAGGVPNEYLRQVVHHLWTTGAAWCDFVSYHPGFPGRLALYVSRCPREVAHPETGEPLLDIYGRAVLSFLDDVSREETRLRLEM